MPVPTAQEVLMWQLINRARLDPVAEAARYGIDLNEGLAAGTIAAGSRQPLAFSNALFVAADGHSQAMIDGDFFAHTNPNTGSTPQTRATAAGYAGQAGENIAWSGSTGGIDATAMIFSQHEDLFVDEFVGGRGHRINILSASYQEVGVGQVIGLFTYQGTTYNTSMVTEDFGVPTTQGQFLTGVFYNDTDNNNFYSVGEGLGAVNVSFSGGGTASEAAGNYSTRLASGTTTVTFSGGSLATSVVASVTLTALRNAEVDVQVNAGVNTLRTSTSLTETSGIGRIVGLGTIGLTLTGDANNDIIDGTSGGDTLFGHAGSDTLNGNDGNDNLVGNADPFAQQADTLNGGNGDDTISGEFTDTVNGGAGTDSLYGVNSFDWSINLGTSSIEWMSAGFGNDTLNAATQAAAVTIYGNGGNDTITGGGFNDTLWGGAGTDTVNGGAGDDVIIGEAGADILSGGDGNDQIYTDGADTSLDGGNNTDALYITGGSGLNLNLATTHFEWVGDYASGADTLNGSGLTVAMVAYAGGGADSVTGGTGADFLWGEAGNDIIVGGASNDTLVGGTGSDTLTGGTGSDTLFGNSGGGGDGVLDTFVFNATGWGTDFIYDFEHLTDKINTQGTGATAGTVTISNVGGHAHVHFGADLIVVVGAGATLTTADFTF